MRPSEKNFGLLRSFSGNNNKARIFFVPTVTDAAKQYLSLLTDLDYSYTSLNWSFSPIDFDLISFNLPYALRDSLMV